jgi:hypothetical protein
VIDVKSIISVIALVPHQPKILGKEDVNEFVFIVEKIGLEIAELGGFTEPVTNN